MIIDLSCKIEEGMPVFPGLTEAEIKNLIDHDQIGWHVDVLSINTHMGTHIDAPYHHLKDGKKLQDYPLEKFVGKGILIDIPGLSEDEEIHRSHLEGASLSEGDFAILKTGWEKYYGTEKYHHHPYLAEDAVEYLAEKKVSIVGIDCFSPDSTSKGTDHAHTGLLSRDILNVENLTNLDQIDPKKNYMYYFLPLSTASGDGAPVRAVCIEE
ncbi:MAG: cyclase family protein [Emergencia sp.]